MARKKATPDTTVVTVSHIDGLGPAARAVSLAYGLMQALKVHRWTDDWPTHIELHLDDAEQALLSEHSGLVSCLRRTKTGMLGFVATECPACGSIAFIRGQAPKACAVGQTCSGTPLRIDAATTTVEKVPAQVSMFRAA